MRLFFVTALLSGLVAQSANAEDGYRLWLRYDPLPIAQTTAYSRNIAAIHVPGSSPTLIAVRNELTMACSGLLRATIPSIESVDRNGVLIAGTPKSSQAIAGMNLDRKLSELGPEGFLIRNVTLSGRPSIVIASIADAGVLYGAFHFLRLLQTGQPIDSLNVSENPRRESASSITGTISTAPSSADMQDGRSGIGRSLPGKVDPRLIDYARANASVGINGTVLNNVNANSRSLNAEYLRKAAAIADAFRPYGLRVYLSARFSAPIELGGLKTADPLDSNVIAWWKKKADEIYAIIPDFGGFLVKANSEGQPGPRTYNRSHVEGANMLAAAVAPHNGIVMWRAFVYDAKPGYDRAAAAYDESAAF